MSKFIDKLGKVGQATQGPIGFGTASRGGQAVPSMALIGCVTPDSLARNPKLVDAQVDAFMVLLSSPVESSLDNIIHSLNERLWGARVGGLDGEQAGKLRETGCDFIAFESDGTEAGVLNDDDLGKVISVGLDLTEDAAGAIHELPIDAVLLSTGDDVIPLTVRRLIEIQVVRGLVGKPLVMESPLQLAPAELEALRNIGVAGLAVELSSVKAIAGMRDAIASLPRRKSRPSSRDAAVPRVPSESGLHIHEEESDDEEDDDPYDDPV